MEKKHLLRVEMLRTELKRRLGEALESGDAGKIAAMANLVKLMGIALAPLAPDDEVDSATLRLTVPQVAQALGFHPEHVRRLLRSGALAGERVGRDYQVTLPSLIAWQDSQRTWGQTAYTLLSPLSYEKAQTEMLAHVALEKEALAWDIFNRFVSPPSWLSARQQENPSSGEVDSAQEDREQES